MRFWKEHHAPNAYKPLSTKCFLLQPSEFPPPLAEQRSLVPYREWINLHDSTIYIHGPFNFATLNNRKTRDRISETEWRTLAEKSNQYNNASPEIRQRNIHVNVTQPVFEIHLSNDEVASRTQAFMSTLEFSDSALSAYGHGQDP
jgi:hypothetical protein